MSGSHPQKPIGVSVVWKELWTRLAVNAGLDDQGEWLCRDNHPDAVIDPEADRHSREELMSQNQDEAHLKLEGQIAVGHIRVWKPKGEDWNLLPPEEALHQIMGRPEDRGRYFLDRQEFDPILACYPAPDLDLTETTLIPLTKAISEKKPRGRPPGAGGFKADDLQWVAEMKELLATGKAQGVHGAAVMVAHKAKGASEASKVRRLNDRYKALENNGA